jgi:hypothetical protein
MTYLGYPVNQFQSVGLDPGQIVAVVLCAIAGVILLSAVCAGFAYAETTKYFPKFRKF